MASAPAGAPHDTRESGGRPAGEIRNPVFARAFARLSAGERGEQVEHRRELLAGLAGQVVELGAGTGSNFAHYPAEVTEVVAVEPERHLRGLAQRAARHAAVPVQVIAAVADRLPFEAERFDAAVASLVLCSVPDQARALAELHRVVKPRGQLRFYEHVRAHHAVAVGMQQAIDLLWPTLAGGCHTGRDTATAIRDAGFSVERCHRLAFRPFALAPPTPHILGIARRQARSATRAP